MKIIHWTKSTNCARRALEARTHNFWIETENGRLHSMVIFTWLRVVRKSLWLLLLSIFAVLWAIRLKMPCKYMQFVINFVSQPFSRPPLSEIKILPFLCIFIAELSRFKTSNLNESILNTLQENSSAANSYVTTGQGNKRQRGLVGITRFRCFLLREN